MDLVTIALAILGAIVYAIVGYARLRDPGEKPDPVKVIRTIIIGVLIGLVAVYKGISFQDADIVVQIIIGFAPIGLSFIIDQVSVGVWKWIKSRFSSSPTPTPEAPQEPPKPE